MQIMTVEFSSRLEKLLNKRKGKGALPKYIKKKLSLWVEGVKLRGIYKMRENKGYHDEPLQGVRSGQRSIRLSLDYRAIYIERKNGEIHIIRVEEVHKHDY